MLEEGADRLQQVALAAHALMSRASGAGLRVEQAADADEEMKSLMLNWKWELGFAEGKGGEQFSSRCSGGLAFCLFVVGL